MDNEELKNTLFNSDEKNVIQSIKSMASRAFLNKIGIRHEKVVIAGGCFTSWFEGKDPKDIDVFVLNSPEAEDKVNQRLRYEPINNLKEGDVSYLNNSNILRTVLDNNSKVQWIFTKYDSRQELINHFDFLHCCVSYEPHVDKMRISRSTYDAIKNKQLFVNNEKQLVAWRTQKFVKRGWKYYGTSNKKLTGKSFTGMFVDEFDLVYPK